MAKEDQSTNRGPTRDRIAELAGKEPLLRVEGLVAGYGKMEILHGIDLQVKAVNHCASSGPTVPASPRSSTRSTVSPISWVEQ